MTKANITKTKELTSSQFQQINLLWNSEYPVSLSGRFEILLDGVENYTHYIIENEHNEVLAWAVEFEKENEIRFSIIVASKCKGSGFGSILINELKADLGEFYGWVIDHDNSLKKNGENYLSPMEFYLKHDFVILHYQRIDSELLKAVKIRRNV